MARGGARTGAGRPKGFGKYQEPTRAVRLPLSIIQSITSITNYNLPLYTSKVAAGFPSPAEDYIANNLNLNEYLVKHPAATFLVRAIGNSMINAGIHDNDLLIVDRSVNPTHGKIVIVAIDGQLTVKRLHKRKNDKPILMADNPDYSPIEISEDNEIHIWGVVVHVIHSV